MAGAGSRWGYYYIHVLERVVVFGGAVVSPPCSRCEFFVVHIFGCKPFQ